MTSDNEFVTLNHEKQPDKLNKLEKGVWVGRIGLIWMTLLSFINFFNIEESTLYDNSIIKNYFIIYIVAALFLTILSFKKPILSFSLGIFLHLYPFLTLLYSIVVHNARVMKSGFSWLTILILVILIIGIYYAVAKRKYLKNIAS